MITDYTHTEFGLQELYRTVFGYTALPFPAGDPSLKSLVPTLPTETIKAIAGQYKPSKLGVYMLVPMRIGDINDKELWQLPVEVMVKIQGKQRIVKRYTHHQGRTGSIKEELGLDDYEIRVNGLFFASAGADNIIDNEDLQESVKILNAYFKKGIVKVECPLLQLFDIDYMSIEKMNFPFNREGLEIIPWELRCLSDTQTVDFLTEIL